MSIMKIENLQAKIGDKQILKGLNLELEPGKVHAIMGPNGAGKSTLSKALVGHYEIEILGGDIVVPVGVKIPVSVDTEISPVLLVPIDEIIVRTGIVEAISSGDAWIFGKVYPISR